MVDDISNQIYQFSQYVLKLIFLAINSTHKLKSLKIWFSYIFFLKENPYLTEDPIWCCQKYCGAYCALFQSIDDTFRR